MAETQKQSPKVIINAYFYLSNYHIEKWEEGLTLEINKLFMHRVEFISMQIWKNLDLNSSGINSCITLKAERIFMLEIVWLIFNA